MSKKVSLSGETFWDFQNQSQNYNKPKIQTTSNIKTVYANGPIYKMDGIKSNTNTNTINKISKPVVETHETNLLELVCIKKDKLNQMINNFFKEKKVDLATRSLIPHLTPIIINYYDNDDIYIYPTLSSKKFQNQVKQYYSLYNVNVSFKNDPDNELWRIYLYPQ